MADQLIVRTATFLRSLTDTFQGDARLYRCDPPMPHYERHAPAEYVIVSAVYVAGEPETYIFAGNEAGNVLDWCAMPGSLRGVIDHVAALTEAEYRLA